MEFLERLNKQKTVFVLALLLLMLTGYRVAAFVFKDRPLPHDTTTTKVQLQKGDPELASRVEPQSFSKFWDFGSRNFFQPPRASISVVGNFTFVANHEGRSDVARVMGYYDCKPDGPVDRVQIQFPQGWTPQTTAAEGKMKVTGGGARREMHITMKELRKADFRLNLTFYCSIRDQTQMEFPEIIFKDAAGEQGMLILLESPSFDLKPKTVEKLDAGQVGSMKRPVYKYTSHPWKLVMELTKKQITAVKPKPPDPNLP